MESILKIVMAALLSIITAIGSLLSTPPKGENPDSDTPPSVEAMDFTYLEYPAEAVKTLKENGVSLKKYKNRATEGNGEYSEARGHDDANGNKLDLGGVEWDKYANLSFK